MNNRNSSQSVAAVVLAFSKGEILKNLIKSMREQTRKPDEIIVIYQGNDLRISEWLAEQHDISLHIQENLGSAGGFSTGIQLSISKGHDWSWIFDDDAVPATDALQRLVDSKYFSSADTGFLCSRIVNPQHKTYMSATPADPNLWFATVLEDHCVRVTKAAWLGVLVSSSAVRQCGLPISEYFIWDEDIEFTSRVAQVKPSYCVVDSAIVHYQKAEFDPISPGDKIKYLYFVRNRVATIRLSKSSNLEKVGRIAFWILKVLSDVFRGKAPIAAILWVAKGLLFFWPKIRYIQ